MRIVAVSELTRYLKDLLAEDPYVNDVWVRGELSGYSQPPSGHRYFSLKDETAQLRCVMWRSAAENAPPLRNGMAVVAHGRMDLYPARGDLQFYVDAIEDAGIGLLHLRFEELKGRLQAEGLFDEERKRPIPARPAVVGLVTSLSGAALRDMLRVLRVRCPLASVLLAPTLVQGDEAAERIATAIHLLNAHGQAEVIVLARGGGSLEDLWAFNEEPVARAIARSHLPVITGVGHETDFTIADFVADYRASTPTAAATACVPDIADWRRGLDEARAQLTLLAHAHLSRAGDRLASQQRNLTHASPAAQIATGRRQVGEATHSLVARIEHLLQLRRAQLRGTALQLHSLSPLLTVGRGYAIVRREPDGAIVTSVTQVSVGQGLTVRVADGSFAATAGQRLNTAPDVAREQPAPARTVGGAQAPAARPVAAQVLSPTDADVIGTGERGGLDGER
jgi:exodeoxyribonuclease VII large subunit